MADYVLLRSPAYFTKSAPVGGSVKLEIRDSNGFVLYEIIKNRRTNSFINFEYSELVRDYVGIYLYDNNEKLVDNVEFELVGTSYTGVNGTGTVVSIQLRLIKLVLMVMATLKMVEIQKLQRVVYFQIKLSINLLIQKYQFLTATDEHNKRCFSL